MPEGIWLKVKAKERVLAIWLQLGQGRPLGTCKCTVLNITSVRSCSSARGCHFMYFIRWNLEPALNFLVVSTILARLIYLTDKGGDTGWPEPTQRGSLVAFPSPDTLGGDLSKSRPFLSCQGWEPGAVCLFLQLRGVAFAGTGDNRMGGDVWRALYGLVWPSPWQIQFAFLRIFTGWVEVFPKPVLIRVKGVGFRGRGKAEVCVLIGCPEDKLSPCAVIPALMQAELS